MNSPEISSAARLHQTTVQPNIRSNNSRNSIFTKNPKADDTLNTANLRQKSPAHRLSILLFHIQQYEQIKLLMTANSNEIIGDTM